MQARIERAKIEKQSSERAALRQKMAAMAKDDGVGEEMISNRRVEDGGRGQSDVRALIRTTLYRWRISWRVGFSNLGYRTRRVAVARGRDAICIRYHRSPLCDSLRLHDLDWQ